MTQATSNDEYDDTPFYELWNEWKDGDDSDLYDSGYYEGILKALEIINDVRNTENVERVPFHLTMSAVASTLRELLKENNEQNS
jgi:hypothetical protein